MGGGVSLGTFSGAALTEVLKLFLLFGLDKTGKPYDSVVLDSFSGASAGAISLAILMRSLLDYQSFMAKDKLNLSREDLVQSLASTYGKEIIEQCRDDKLECLLAAEVAQRMQEKIWVEEAEIVRLFKGVSAESDVVSRNFGILKRDLLIDLADRYLIDGCEQLDTGNRQLLDDRVLFACSLTSILGKTLPEEEEKHPSIPLYNEYLKATPSYEHKELRVIDFQFNQDSVPTEDNWLKVQTTASGSSTTGSSIENRLFNLASVDTWAMFAASVIACGAFPLAFEPTVLERNISELPPFKLNGGEQRTKKYAYIDGGTFNNEPIREAFRLANYIDLRHRGKAGKKEEDRLIVFVYPYVPPSQYRSGRIPSFEVLQSRSDKLNNLQGTTLMSEVSRAGSQLNSLISVLRDQGALKEENKSLNYLENLKVKAALSDYIHKIRINVNNQQELNRLVDQIVTKITNDLKRSYIPPGTRNLSTFFNYHLKKIYEEAAFPEDDKQGILEKLQKIFDTYVNMLNDSSATKGMMLPKVMQQSKPEDQEIIYKVLLNMLAEVALDTYGKDEQAIRMAVTPIAYPQETALPVGQSVPANSPLPQTVFLPGSELAAFGGFASERSRRIAFLYGRYCSLKALSRKDFRQNHDEMLRKLNQTPANSEPFINGQTRLISEHLKANIQAIYQHQGFNVHTYAKDLGEHLISLAFKRIKRLIPFSMVLRPVFKFWYWTLSVMLLIVAICWGLSWILKSSFLSALLSPLVFLILSVIVLFIYLKKKLKKTLITHTIEKVKRDEISVKIDLPEQIVPKKRVKLELYENTENGDKLVKVRKLKIFRTKVKNDSNSTEKYCYRIAFKLAIGQRNHLKREKYFYTDLFPERDLISPLKYFEAPPNRRHVLYVQRIRVNKKYSIELGNAALDSLNQLDRQDKNGDRTHFLYPVLKAQWNKTSKQFEWMMTDEAIPLEWDILQYAKSKRNQ